MIILLTILCIACERKPLYLKGEFAFNINVTVDADINTMWNPHWKDSLVYDWDESVLGKIGYTNPQNVDLVLFDGNKFAGEYPIVTGKPNVLDISLGREYNILLYNNNDIIQSSYIGGNYYIETPGLYQSKRINDVKEKYTTTYQPGEIFSSYIRNIWISEDTSEYSIYYENGKNIYVYNIDAILNPVSYIYIIQFIIINDDDTEIEAESILCHTVSGISTKKNLFNNKPVYTGLKQIYTEDVKYPQIIDDKKYFATRVTVLDLLPEDETSSWHADEYNLYYLTMSVKTKNYGEISGTKDITKQMNENPHGGILSVKILNSELKSGSSSGDGFGVTVGEWESHVIDIAF